MRLLWSAAAVIAAVLPTVHATTNTSVLANITSNPQLDAFASFLGGLSGLIGELQNSSSITVFAPSNDAIAAIGQDPALAASIKDPNFLVALLRYHVLHSTVKSTDFSPTPFYAHTLLNDSNYANVTGGQVIGLQKYGESLTLTSGLKRTANIIAADVPLPNGVLHIIDGVLTIPPAAPSTIVAANLTAFGGALSKSSSSSSVALARDLTIFAPSNLAFTNIDSIASGFDQAQLNDAIAYHIIPDSQGYSPLLANTTGVATLAGGSQTLNVTCVDGGIFANAARVIFADILVAQGVLHVIDAVLNPNATAQTANPTATTAPILYPVSGSSVTGAALWFTSGQSTPTATNSAFSTTTDRVIAGYSTQPTRNPASATSSTAHSSTGGAASIAKATGVAERMLMLGGGTVVAAAAAVVLAV